MIIFLFIPGHAMMAWTKLLEPGPALVVCLLFLGSYTAEAGEYSKTNNKLK